MIWTVITIDPAHERAKHHVFDSLPHDSDKAYTQAQKELPNQIVIALVRGNHNTSTHVPSKTINVFC
jgi:hypothetical protein